jgi:hypothetical protein
MSQNGHKVLSADELLAATALPQEPVELGKLGIVYVRGMTGRERDAWEASLMRGKGSDRRPDTRNARARLAVRCLVNADGTRMYTDNDAERLGNIRADYLQKIFDVSQRMSGVTDEDIEELGKYSGSADGGASSSS